MKIIYFHSAKLLGLSDIFFGSRLPRSTRGTRICGNSRLVRYLGCDRGSATVEFSALAIPLFLPIFLFLQQFGALSSEESIARTLARESVRAFISSSSDDTGRVVAGEVIRVGGRELGLTDAQLRGVTLTFDCSDSPCLSPNARVRARVEIKSFESGRSVIASAQEYVSPWR